MPKAINSGFNFWYLFSAPLSVQVTPTRQRIDVGKDATISCDIVRGFPTRKLVWLHNGKEIHAENVEETFMQVTNNANNSFSGMTVAKDNDTNWFKQALSKSSLSSLPSTSLPLSSPSSIVNPSTLTLKSKSEIMQGDDEHRTVVDHGKVYVL